MRRQTPQQRKALDYEKSRRNCRGENDKSSRKNIPRHRARTHREFRRKAHVTLHDVGASPPEELQNNVEAIPRQHWKKWPDMPLRTHIEAQQAKRIRTGQNQPD